MNIRIDNQKKKKISELEGRNFEVNYSEENKEIE